MIGQTSNGNKRAPKRAPIRATAEPPAQSAGPAPAQESVPRSPSPLKLEWRDSNNAEREFYAGLGRRLCAARHKLPIKTPGKEGRTASLHDVVSRMPAPQIGKQLLYKYEIGDVRPSCFILKQLADVLGVSVAYLMTGEE